MPGSFIDKLISDITIVRMYFPPSGISCNAHNLYTSEGKKLNRVKSDYFLS